MEYPLTAEQSAALFAKLYTLADQGGHTEPTVCSEVESRTETELSSDLSLDDPILQPESVSRAQLGTDSGVPQPLVDESTAVSGIGVLMAETETMDTTLLNTVL